MKLSYLEQKHVTQDIKKFRKELIERVTSLNNWINSHEIVEDDMLRWHTILFELDKKIFYEVIGVKEDSTEELSSDTPFVRKSLNDFYKKLDHIIML